MDWDWTSFSHSDGVLWLSHLLAQKTWPPPWTGGTRSRGRLGACGQGCSWASDHCKRRNGSFLTTPLSAFPSSSRPPANLTHSLNTFRLTRKYNARNSVIIQCNMIHFHKGILINPRMQQNLVRSWKCNTVSQDFLKQGLICSLTANSDQEKSILKSSRSWEGFWYFLTEV